MAKLSLQKLRSLTKKQYAILGVLVVVFIIVAISFTGNGNGTKEYIVVEQRDVIEEVAVSGRVEAGIVADLGFEVTGSVQSVLVEVGQEVLAGTPLITLSLGTLPAELAIAQADVSIKEAQTSSNEESLVAVIGQQNTLVDNAYRTLLSTNLIAKPKNDSTTQTPPTISGAYTGLDGQYDVRFKRGQQFGDYELFIKGIENISKTEVEDNINNSTLLGTRGLTISFSDNLSEYVDTSWLINIPNIESSLYTTNLGLYEKALKDREVAIENAQSELSTEATGFSVAQAKLSRAQAEVSRINAEIAKRTLKAPFNGVVSAISVDLGEIVSANETVMQIISKGEFGVEVDLPEVDSVKVQVGDKVMVTIDAFGDDVFFDATVVSVNRTETIVNNVSVYESRLVFDNEDERIRSGMTADVVITTDMKENVLAVPARALRFREDGSSFVFVNQNGKNIETDVVLGLRGSDGFIEVQAGLSESDTIVIQTN